ncbi:ER lumen protein-retaining receptor [Iris pallida]|uniref:ER lumen protein-retaining receptor n=1 Tax=Iris pallida TaxID=29817 RepID=A0AAX6G748_IRIPA|nr:ER lumen protein-retaining receptor [Iris pallida]KAJ6824178.1 ER lumen protein-retaining receptor [Iris pallida]
MNIFRLAGDMTHLMSVVVLLLKIHTIKSCAGVSLKTQELYALVFACRYLDIFTDFISLYNTTMKLIFLGTSFSIVWYMRYHKIVRRSYDKDQDTFRHFFLILPCLLLALLINERFTFKEVMWAFSLYLEAVAILPQLVLLQRTRNIDNLTGQYVFLLGAYRSFYILNWIYRYFTEPHYVHWISMEDLPFSRLYYLVHLSFFGIYILYFCVCCDGSLGVWSSTDVTLCRFLLLLFQ